MTAITDFASLVNQYEGYRGWDPQSALQDFQATGGAGKQGSTSITSSQSNNYLDSYQSSVINSFNPSPDINADILRKHFGFNDQAVIDGVLNDPGQRERYQREYAGILNPGGGNDGIKFEDIKSQLQPQGEKPAPLSRTALFGALTQAYGVQDLEGQLNQLKDQQRAIEAQYRVNTTAERGKPVAQNVIEGRVSQQTRNSNEQLDFVMRQQAYITDQLNSAYNIVGMYVNFAGMDYESARREYEFEYSTNLQMYQTYQEERQFSYQQRRDQVQDIKDERNFQFEVKKHQTTVAQSTLQTYMNAILSGNLNYESVSPDQRANLDKLSAQAGFPPGFLNNIQMNPQEKILFMNQSSGQIVTMGLNGEIKTQKIPGYVTSGPSSRDTSHLFPSSSEWEILPDQTTANSGTPNFSPTEGFGTVTEDAGASWIFTPQGWISY